MHFGGLQINVFISHHVHVVMSSSLAQNTFKMGHIDGHEIAFVSTIAGCAALIHRTLPKGWSRALVHRQPIASMAIAWAVVGLSLPLVIPPIRRSMGFPTNQYDAENPKTVFPKYNY
jgi:hypothetical protein